MANNLKIDNINFKDQKIILSNGKEYSLGDEVEIIVNKVSIEESRITFSLINNKKTNKIVHKKTKKGGKKNGRRN